LGASIREYSEGIRERFYGGHKYLSIIHVAYHFVELIVRMCIGEMTVESMALDP